MNNVLRTYRDPPPLPPLSISFRNFSCRVINLDRHKQGRYFIPTKYRSKGPRMSLEDRPKWGINRPAIEYKKQSEKDPYYQKRLKQRLKNIGRDATSSSDQTIKNEDVTKNDEKELQSVARLLELPIEMRNNTEEEEEEEGRKTEIILRNGFRMNSNLSSPVFVPIDNRIKSTDFKFDKSNKYAVESEKIFQRRIVKREMITDEEVEEEDTTEVENEKISDSDTGNFLNDLQLEAIRKITDLREVFYAYGRIDLSIYRFYNYRYLKSIIFFMEFMTCRILFDSARPQYFFHFAYLTSNHVIIYHVTFSLSLSLTHAD